ncbi:MAG TPA: tripartite tricarboxylate transporter substrate binding protein [Noviherbaspirillum sp.]
MKSALKQLGAVALTAAAVLAASHAGAQTFPTKQVNLVVPYPAGGATDVIARLVAEGASKAWGQPVIVNNKPGAGTVLAADMVAKSPADGYTLYMTTAAHTISDSLYKKLPYSPMKDFEPITLTSVIPLVLVTSNNLPAKNLKELLAHLKANPQTSFASTGNGTPQHLTGALFMAKNNMEMMHVPYKGDAPMLNDLIGNHVGMAFITLSAALPHIKAGKIRPIALAHSKRIDAIADVPTFTEAGMPGFEAATWFGLLAPAGMPAALKQKIYQDVHKVVASPEITKQLVEMGGDVTNTTPERFKEFMQLEAKSWAEAVKLSGAQVQ